MHLHTDGSLHVAAYLDYVILRRYKNAQRSNENMKFSKILVHFASCVTQSSSSVTLLVK